MARGAVFGLTSSRRGRGSHFRGNWRKNNRGGGRSGKNPDPNAPPVVRGDDGSQIQERFENTKVNDEVDEKMGFVRLSEGSRQEGWLVNMHTTLVKDSEWPGGRSAVDYYFIKDDGGMFKCTLHYDPYFLIACKSGTETGVEEFLMKKYEGMICRISREKKEDLKMPNHLLGYRKLYLQLNFRNISDLLTVRRDLLPLALANGKKLDAVDAYAEVVNAEAALRIQVDGEETRAWGAEGDETGGKNYKDKDPRENIIDIREYDVPYYLRVAIDNDIRVGLWYAVSFVAGQPLFTPMPERVKRADPVVMAFDIETTKAPLKFPDPTMDQVMMISYMIDGQGYLITNREIVSEDIEDFEYTPKEGYEGPFTIFNENDEASTIGRFFEHIRQVKPTVMATFNGDFFDFPFLRARAEVHGMDMFLETGFAKDSEDEYKSRTCAHMDCFRWVKRDSYLPQGSQGLKAVTTAKLGYNPIELDPELMTPYAIEQPQILAQYSVSDAVATYYLYMKYVHPFIFSLCNIIPLNPDEVLRKGSGTLCETLLMVEAYRGSIIMPNRHEDPFGNMFEGHLLASETYVGGHVEALEAGVFRSDIPTHFKIVPQAVQQLIDELDAALKFCIVEESKMSLDNVTNYDEVKGQIQRALEEMRDHPVRVDEPLIYHLDVAAMYPNIMLSNRLQPDSVVDESVCAVCDYNTPDKTCDRRMTWAWRGEFFPAHRDEYNMVRHALNQETFPPKRPGDDRRRFVDLTEAEQTALLHKRLGDYSRKVYKKTKDTKVVYRESIICQRENPFYVDTVRRFRDRRYEYKGLHKTWKKNLDSLMSENASMAQLDEAKKLIVVYDSLQLAHKCILNSFYGYVMRKGARWHSMEMAGITCLTGATIIQMARQLVEQIGRPLELDTDGIWCMLPGIFPENFTFKVIKGKPVSFSYPCTMLNHLVHAKFTNHQYHDYDKQTGRYVAHSENSIFFELDGPYRAMILPSSKEEDKLLKKRYAVFNPDGSLAELKGFEVKRRGELQLIKIFQTQIFEKYLLGTTTEECYKAVAEVADRWLDILFTKGESLTNDELVELIAENRSMSKTLAEYGGQKSTSISTARRLAEFLGDQMVKDKGLACKFIISAKPVGAPVTDRAVPVAIFSAEEKVKRTYLRKWLKDNSLANFDLRSILDWNYYIERLGSVIQKLITIPAAMQRVSNPVPRIRHPDWLHKRVVAMEDKFQQHKVTDFFKKVDPALKSASIPADMEDFGTQRAPKPVLSNSNNDEEPSKAPKKPLPNPSVNYSAWLKAMRLRWKERREANLDASNAQILPAMFRGVKVRASRSWDVLQIRPGRGPGRFILWLSVDTELVPITLRVPREFYINLKLPPKEDTFDERYAHEKLIRTLPRNRPCLNLYKITTPEDLYVKEESHFINLINNPNVDGAYELKVPLVVRTLLKLGSSCSLVNSGETTLNRARDIGFDLRQLERSNTRGRSKYLNDGQGFKYIFLYHAISLNGSIHVFAVFNPMGSVHLHVVDPATRRQPLVQLQELYQEFMKQIGDVPSLINYPANLDFTTSYHGNDGAALKVISRELTALENRSYILLLSSSKNLEYFEDNIPKLSKFPVFAMPHNRSAHILDALPWQMDVAKKMLTRYLCVGQWLRVTLDQAVYYDVPIGHIEGDYPLFMADIEFARRLQKQDILLWWSPGERPDWGGMEDDFQQIEDLRSPEFHAPGCYSNVCLSMKMKNLAIDAVLQSAVVNELEGSGGTTTFDSTSHTLDDYSQGLPQTTLTLGDSIISPQIFGIVKAMVKAWLLDKARATESPSPPDIAVEHFWRWISSNSAHMFDPNLQRFIHGLMLKTFIQLRAEFKRLGSSVVYADFNQILLVTSKPPGTAFAYAAYLTSAVNSHELFKHIFFEMENYYDFLLYMDNFNCGALHQDYPGKSQANAKMILKMDWSIQRFLPLALQRHFTEAVKYFILEMSRIKHKGFENGRTPMKVLENLSQNFGTQIDEAKQKEIENCRTFISQRLTRKLLRMVGQIMDDYRRSLISADDEEPEMDFAFPILPGSHLSMSNPPLEFIKSICAVFGLAKDFSTEIGIVKRNLLDLIGVREFAEEAIFKNPCEPLKLSMVICQHCSAIRDLDFCRDATLFPLSVRAVKKWCCLECGCDYDRVAIEFALISLVLRMETAFVPQDLKCGKCKQLRSDNLSRRCKCSGNYQLTLNATESRRKLRTLVNIATVHNLQRLKETAQIMLENW
ncbi:hypothetical protein Clacol_007195 [Clathrus columnatus]|uniref:DNA polymerase epsilon catalytic subunit n=1 Tax=Clathrus columnatus TaxID=1419009 RepID=A0AAV5AHH5_9AGAM|nr:hypothetical protein Clacol_007195 [Clathrus columnatus]